MATVARVAALVEGDWPAAHRLNRYINDHESSADTNAIEALRGFEGFPRWMWRNRIVAELAEFLRTRNVRVRAARKESTEALDTVNAMRDAGATEAQLAVTQESLATTKGRIEEAENRIVVNQNQNLALLTQQRRYRVQLMRQTDGLAARTRRLTLSQDTLLETSQKMEVLRMRQCRAADCSN